MAGKHRQSPRRRSASAPRPRLPSLVAAAVAATSLTTALTTGATASVAAPAVELAALVTPANSTAQIFAGSDYYNQNWVAQYGQPQVVPFFLGPQGIVTAIDRNDGDPDRIAVLASGWGAGQTGTAIGIMAADPANHPGLDDLDLVVLDNNTNRAGGGFWTTYGLFAPLLLTSAAPTPSNTQAPILDVSYEYNINSNAPTDPLNLLADINSLVAYFYGYRGEATAPVPQGIIDEAKNADPTVPHYHYVLDESGQEIDKFALPAGTTTTYVTFKSERLPLVRPLLLIPGGVIIADAIEPLLTMLVNAGYKDNQPIPDDPTVPRPMEPGSSISNIITAINSQPAAVQQADMTQREILTTGPLNETKRTTGVLTSSSPGPQISAPPETAAQPTTLASPSQLVTVADTEKPRTTGVLTNNSPDPLPSNDPSKPSTSAFDITATNKNSPDPNSTSTPSSGRNNPVRQVIGNTRSSLGDLANSLAGGDKKDATGTTPAATTSGASTPGPSQ